MGNAAFGCQQKTGAAFAAFQANLQYFLEQKGLSLGTSLPEQVLSGQDFLGDMFKLWEQATYYYFENLQRVGLLASEQSRKQWFAEALVVEIQCQGGMVSQEWEPFVAYGVHFFEIFFRAYFKADDAAVPREFEFSLEGLLAELSTTVLKALFLKKVCVFPAQQGVYTLQ